MFALFLPLAKKVEKIAEKKDFINENKELFNKLVEKKNFDGLINYIYDLLDQLRIRKTDYNFEEIQRSLIKFEQMNNIVKDRVKELKNKKRYSPLFWLGSQQNDKELKGAYLEELNKGLKGETKLFLNSLGNEEQFWERSSEIFFTNKFLDKKDKYLPESEVQISKRGSKTDLRIRLKNKKVYFEIKRLGTNRNLTLDNGAVFIKNKAKSILDKIHSQHFSEELLEQIRMESNKTMFFAVLDVSSSNVDEHEIVDALYGSLAIQMLIDKKTGKVIADKTIREADSIYDKNKNTSILSGVIFFKTKLELENNKPKLKLKGDIIPNPNAINKPTEEELKELKEVIFEV
jgi:hypothetical protein